MAPMRWSPKQSTVPGTRRRHMTIPAAIMMPATTTMSLSLC